MYCHKEIVQNLWYIIIVITYNYQFSDLCNWNLVLPLYGTSCCRNTSIRWNISWLDTRGSNIIRWTKVILWIATKIWKSSSVRRISRFKWEFSNLKLHSISLYTLWWRIYLSRRTCQYVQRWVCCQHTCILQWRHERKAKSIGWTRNRSESITRWISLGACC
jgi:hypothetical protein